MHLQGGKRRSPPATVGEIVHEAGNPHNEAKVVDAGPSHVTVESLDSGAEHTLGRFDFKEIFEY